MGGILFTHKSIGQHGKEIIVYKIRTMKGPIPSDRNAEVSLSGVLDKTDSDRLTSIGKILRPIGIDEIPQLYNLLILRNMQLIGIRPFLPEEFRLLPIHLQEALKREKPGMIPAEAYYCYQKGSLHSRVSAIESYITEKPKGIKKLTIGIRSLLNRWSRYSNR